MVLEILVAEDNVYTAKQYKTALEKRGHTVTVTHDGIECLNEYVHEVKYLELFKKTKFFPFDLVLLDQDMPNKNGASTAQDILSLQPNQRIIFLSAFGKGILSNVKNLRDNSVQIIQKPFSLDFLIKKVEGKLIKSRIAKK